MAEDHTAYIGTRRVWGGERPFGLCRADRRQHLYCVGKTGTGKSTLLRNLILQDIEAGEGVGLIDPHGELAEELLDFIPPRRTDDVVYFNPADHDYPVGLNLLQPSSPQGRHLVASAVVSAMKNIWRESWGPRLEYVLYASLAALLECENTTLLGVPRLLTDAFYRDWVIKQIKDPAVQSFWTKEFANYDKRFLAEVTSPVLNKVQALLMSPPIRNVLGQVRSRFDPRFMMDRRRILIANLSKGRLGEDKANLLGAVLVGSFQAAALGRADVPQAQRPDYFFYVDEFQNFATDSFATLLSESRKYHLCLHLFNQYVEQLPDTVRLAVLGNVGSMLSFRVGESDAEALSREFGDGCHPTQFSDLPNYEMMVRVMNGGRLGAPFLAKTDPPAGRRYGKGYNIIRRSRERYATPHAVVEDKIRRWMRS